MQVQPSALFLAGALLLPVACGGQGSGRGDGDGQTSLSTLTDGETATDTASGDASDDASGTGMSSASAGSGTAGEDDETGSVPKFDLGGSQGTGGSECEMLSFEAAAERPDVMLVLDKSGSMDFNYWDFMGMNLNRWDSLYLTVEAVVTQFDAQADFGTELFPYRDAPFGQVACDPDNPITVPVAPMNGAAILAAIPQIGETVGGSTPMGGGISLAKAHLEAIASSKPQAMILVADGGVSTSCGSPNSVAEIVTMLEDMAAAGVPTYVVGIDANTQSLVDQLNAFAEAGGQPLPGAEKFYNAQDGNALLADLGEIVEGVLSCTVPLDPEPVAPDTTVVNIDGMEWPQVTDCENEHGWIYSVEFSELTLCGNACQSLKDSGHVDITYHCPQG
jgi:hypothetical protein